MGIPGAGKSHVAEEYVERGYVRLNRDEPAGRCASSFSRWRKSCVA